MPVDLRACVIDTDHTRRAYGGRAAEDGQLDITIHPIGHPAAVQLNIGETRDF